MDLKPLPVGIEDFKDLIHKGYYYVDTHQLFRDLDIMKEDDIYLQHMGKHPVIFLSLKNAK